jgi:hypothetical protein
MSGTIDGATLAYTVTPLITTAGVFKTQTISSTNGVCTGVLLSSS